MRNMFKFSTLFLAIGLLLLFTNISSKHKDDYVASPLLILNANANIPVMLGKQNDILQKPIPILDPLPIGDPIQKPNDLNVSTPQWVSTEITFTSAKKYSEPSEGIHKVQEAFETQEVPKGWSNMGGSIKIDPKISHNGSKSLCFLDRKNKWDSPLFNIYDIVKSNGPGNYIVSFWLYVDKISAQPNEGSLLIRGKPEDANSFIKADGKNFFATLASGIPTKEKTWTEYSAEIKILESDISREKGTFNLAIDKLELGPDQKIYIDDFEIFKENLENVKENFPQFGINLDVTFTSENNMQLTVPAFWDGGSTWKVRFAPTQIGKWTFVTNNSDVSDSGLHDKHGTVMCLKNTSKLDIFIHGFLKISENKRYFIYADGKPFFYLGDTHWNLPAEDFDTSNISTIPSQLKHIVDKRVEQGFTVLQSEPIGAKYKLANGLTESDIVGFKELDKRFKYIAEKGLVHANAQLFFANELAINGKKYSDAYLEKLCRYWVARFASYPVVWTIAQEVDKNFYNVYDTASNPWKKVATWMIKYDPYHHPLSAHQENTGHTTASNSSFKNIPGHNWYAVQWSPAKSSQLDFKAPKNYWNSETRKPIINYEGCYDHLWTLEFGARQQGWTAFLNGMYGHGYGAADIWLYNGTYDMASATIRDGDTISVEEKKIKWNNSVNFPAANQLGFMHQFFQTLEWWNLTPRFDDPLWFSNNGSFYSIASKNNELYVAYFYNRSNKNCGTLKGLENVPYKAQWFNPITGDYNPSVTITIKDGTYNIGNKPDNHDWVLLLKKQ